MAGEVESWAGRKRLCAWECEIPESCAFAAVGGVAWRERKGDIQRSRTSDARLSMAACKHWITRRLSAAELIGRPSNRLM
jgi:hypothetical protein